MPFYEVMKGPPPTTGIFIKTDWEHGPMAESTILIGAESVSMAVEHVIVQATPLEMQVEAIPPVTTAALATTMYSVSKTVSALTAVTDSEPTPQYDLSATLATISYTGGTI